MLDSAACFNVAFDVAFVHADAATEQKPSKVVAFEPRWMHVAYEGTWRGYRTGEFTFTPDDLRQMVGNHRANPQYRPNTLSVTKEDIQRGQYGVFRIDWRHLSEAPPAEVPIELQKARGWVLELEVRAPAAPGDVSGVRAQGNKAELWAYGYFTEEAASMINNHEVKWLSITAYPNALDKVTGGNIGWWVSSIALTPSPFLQGLTALPFQAEHPAPTATTGKTNTTEPPKPEPTAPADAKPVETKISDNGSNNAAARKEDKMFKLAKKTMEMLGLKPDNEDPAELSSAIDRMCMEHGAMSKQLADMTAEVGEYKKQFGALKKACGDENMAFGQIGVVIAEAMSAKARYEQEAPKIKILLETSIASEKLDAKADIERVMAEGQIDAKYRDMVESFRLGNVPDDKLTTPEALAVRLEARKTFLAKYPQTGDAHVLLDHFGGKAGSHIDAGTQGGVGFGAASRHGGNQGGQRKKIMLTDENRQQREIDLRSFAPPNAEFDPIQCAVTALQVLFPTKYGKATPNTSSTVWAELNQQAYAIVMDAHNAGAI